MSTLTITPEIQAILGQLKDRTELVDAAGNVVGVFTPPAVVEHDVYEKLKGLFDLEEAKRRVETETEFYTTEQVLEHLKSLETSK